MKIIFLGPPGSGKGTYASRVQAKFGWPQISTGDLLREEVKKNTEIGKKADSYMKEGKLVPDEIVLSILKERVSQDDCKNGFILDGFPRTIEQAKELEKITGIDVVVNLMVPKEIIIDRLSSRRVCRKCGAVYNIKSMKPKVDGICDKCGGELYQRKDDTIEVIEKRFEIYHEQTAPLIDFYKDRGILIDVECNEPDASPDVMVEKIIKRIEEFTSS